MGIGMCGMAPLLQSLDSSSSPGQEVKLAGTWGPVTTQGETLTHGCSGGEALLHGHKRLLFYRLAASGHLCGGQRSWLEAHGSGPCFPGLFPCASARYWCPVFILPTQPSGGTAERQQGTVFFLMGHRAPRGTQQPESL